MGPSYVAIPRQLHEPQNSYRRSTKKLISEMGRKFKYIRHGTAFVANFDVAEFREVKTCTG